MSMHHRRNSTRDVLTTGFAPQHPFLTKIRQTVHAAEPATLVAETVKRPARSATSFGLSNSYGETAVDATGNFYELPRG
ncbi:hypothetical protein M407DRAFT_243363 [Tulasnella calospora MUT 4182]|uniref:Uncharacterized protein n=1 Tax=Tulasnella calospora MUT 4182 TaxID=1051891 RepID=A0A0C3QAS5_9AGAM|nr:hypothetical protein M407DRAFT_243363 [Tulasnella calospora MUT 4182]